MTKRKTITYEEIAYSNMMSIEALVSLLTRKGLITEQEILDELKAISINNNIKYVIELNKINDALLSE